MLQFGWSLAGFFLVVKLPSLEEAEVFGTLVDRCKFNNLSIKERFRYNVYVTLYTIKIGIELGRS